MPILPKLLKSIGIIDQVAEAADKFIHTKDEKAEFQKELYRLAMADRSGARKMFSTDAIIQKVLSITFLCGYFGMLLYFLVAFYQGGFSDLIDWQIAFLSSIFASMTTKLNTIVDFFFGSSDQTQKK